MRKGRPSKKYAGTCDEQEELCSCNTNAVCFVCKQCQELVCTKCRAAYHRHHESDTISVVAGELRNEIQKYNSIQKKERKLDDIAECKRAVADMKKTAITEEQCQIDKIDEHVNELHRLIKDLRHNLVRKMNEVTRKETEELNKTDRKLDRLAASLNTICGNAKQTANVQDDITVVKQGYSICEELNEAFETEITPINSRTDSIKYIPGTIDSGMIAEMVGEVHISLLQCKILVIIDISPKCLNMQLYHHDDYGMHILEQ